MTDRKRQLIEKAFMDLQTAVLSRQWGKAKTALWRIQFLFSWPVG